ncbi:hypothetical protein ADK70_32005 [Streptomyces rimosus subsp. pseudoverticillatus]|uniref:hypothetical protein n=1 Tax=Streptomyces rimosus TaxID=1927 RepID=UPI0006B2A052|nr:hypothetical protein [Streptomyces rimosus]KOT79130.1 hypothetical protein ADK70_32005 [Streptomyces rimosus subsp. pseudoverticillatus]
MTAFPLNAEHDPARRAIITAMNRLLAGTPQRSNGRLNVTQLAIEAGVKRWHLTHQHTDLKDLFQAHVVREDAQRADRAQDADAYAVLKKKHSELLDHCRGLETRLNTYAHALNALALENAALSGRSAQNTNLRALPRRGPNCHNVQ